MPHLVDFPADSPLIDALLGVSLAGIILYRPIPAVDGQIEDFAFVRLNAVAQHLLHLPERPVETYLTRYPHVAVQETLAFCCEAYAADDVRYFDWEYAHDGVRAYSRLAAQRCGGLLVVSFTEHSHQERTSMEAALRAHQQAEQSEARFRRLAETAPMIVWEADAAGHTTYVSPHWAQITTGINGRGLGWREYVHPDDQEAFWHAWQQAVRTHHPFQHELRLRLAATGEYRWFLDRADPVRDATGQVVQWVGAAADIDAQKRVQQALHASEQDFRHRADLVPTLIWETDASGACVYLNASWYAYTGQQPSDALGRGWEQAVHPDDVPRVAALVWPAVSAGQPFTVVYRLRNRNGDYCWVTDSGRPRRDAQGAVVGYLGAVTNIDEQKRAEQALQQRTGELRMAHDLAQVLNAELAARNEELQRLNVELDTFVYMASHDLRAPLLNVDGLVVALQEELSVSALPPTAAHILALLRDTMQRFTETVEQLTDVARAQQQPDILVPVDLLPIIGSVQLDLQPLIRQTRARIDVKATDCCVMSFAPKNARSVVYNLLSNALKYRHPDRVPHVRIECRLEAQFVVLIVQDNGLGLTLDEQATVFDPFQRLHNHVEGHGIGLYMIKRIVENAGGRIQVESKAGVGTIFRVYFRR